MWKFACLFFYLPPMAFAWSASIEFEIPQKEIATDEFGRRCELRSGTLRPLGDDLYILEGSLEDGLECRNGTTFWIPDGKTRAKDHGFLQLFKYYATQACHVTEEEAQSITECLFDQRAWKSIRAWLENKKANRYQTCIGHATCTNGFRRLVFESGFQDLVILEKGRHVIRGAGANASNYILRPEFDGEIDLKGHSKVFHLKHHKCDSPDVFRGCVQVN